MPQSSQKAVTMFLLARYKTDKGKLDSETLFLFYRLTKEMFHNKADSHEELICLSVLLGEAFLSLQENISIHCLCLGFSTTEMNIKMNKYSK